MSIENSSDKYMSYVDGDYTVLLPYIFPSLLLSTDVVGSMEINP